MPPQNWFELEVERLERSPTRVDEFLNNLMGTHR
jgi:hypothetical protein